METPENQTPNEEQQGTDDPFKDTSPAQPVDAGPESATSAAAEDNDVVQGDDPEPEPTDQDQGDDPDADNLPGAGEDVSAESVEADPDDTHGANDHPEA